MKATRVRLVRNENVAQRPPRRIISDRFLLACLTPVAAEQKDHFVGRYPGKNSSRRDTKLVESRVFPTENVSRIVTVSNREGKKRRGGGGGRRENYFPGAGERQNDPTPDVEFRQRCLSVGIEFSFLIDWSSSFFFFFFFFIVQNEKLEQSRRSFASYPHALATGSRTITSDRVRFVAFSKNTHNHYVTNSKFIHQVNLEFKYI